MPTTSTTTNGANGAHDSRSNSIPPVTKILASFVADADPSTYLTPRVRDRLKEYILDFIGVTLAAGSTSDSTPSFLQAVTALGGRTGSSTVLGQGKHFTPQYAGLLNAALGHSLDFDDTYAKGTLHAGVTAIAAGLTQAEINGDGGSGIDDFLVAVAVGYEITCRLGREMGNDAYARGFHNTSTCGVFGAVATICVLKHLPVQTVLDAFGLAGSKAAGSMQYLANGSWNKRLHPGFAVHDAFVAVALAEAGVLGAADIFEGTFGFLHAYSPKPDKDLGHLSSELGERWEFLDTSLKPFPACRMTHGFIEHATRLGREKGHTKASDYKTVTLSLSPANVSVVGAPIPNKVHPANMVDAQFSAYFTAAHSFLYGSGAGVGAYERQRLDDPQIRELSDKITCVGDESIREFGSRIEVEYADGSKEVVDIPYPLGEVQHPFTRDQVDQKFFSLVNPVLGEKRALRIRDVVNEIEKHNSMHVDFPGR
ncbi:hypothetical protein LTS17_003430 [Exophiala oligosperma]